MNAYTEQMIQRTAVALERIAEALEDRVNAAAGYRPGTLGRLSAEDGEALLGVLRLQEDAQAAKTLMVEEELVAAFRLGLRLARPGRP